MYYDVVCSVYKENENGVDYRVDSHLLCGGFKTEDEAMEYINTHNCTEYTVDLFENLDAEKSNLYTCIEVEEHNENGIVNVVMVD